MKEEFNTHAKKDEDNLNGLRKKLPLQPKRIENGGRRKVPRSSLSSMEKMPANEMSLGVIHAKKATTPTASGKMHCASAIKDSPTYIWGGNTKKVRAVRISGGTHLLKTQVQKQSPSLLSCEGKWNRDCLRPN